MATLALGVIGSAIGGAVGGTFLGVSAATIGWMAGSYLGSLIDQKSQNSQGPRLSDLALQASTYGGMVPLIRGTIRTAGNVVWGTDKREVATTEDVGGKGGGSVSQTTYTYNVDVAIALCEGVKAGVRKIWNNGKLIYDVSAGIDAASVIASTTRSAAFRFYPGNETQLPDPTIEAALGVGNAPAFRGTCYVVLEQLECPNGQMPQLTFELVESATFAPEAVNHMLAPQVNITSNAMILSKTGGWLLDTSTSGRWQLVEGGAVNSGFVDYVLSYIATQPWRPAQGSGSHMLRWVWASDWFIEELNLATGQVSRLWDDPATETVDRVIPKAVSYDPTLQQYVTFSDTGEMGSRFIVLPSGIKGDVLPSGTVLSSAAYNGVVYVALADGGNTVVRIYNAADGAETGSVVVTTPAEILANEVLLSAHAGGVFAYVYKNDAVNFHPSRVYRINGTATPTLLASFALGVGPDPVSVWCGGEYSLIGPFPDGAGLKTMMVRYAALTPNPIALSDVVQDLCERSGIPGASIDVSALSATVPGYGVARLGSGRAALDPLLVAWFVDATETDGVLRFSHRYNKAPVATIGWDDLAAGTDGAQAEAAPLDRTQEAELPRSVAVTFINIAADYQPGSEQLRRQNTVSINDQSQDLPIATSADHAAAVAQGLLYTAWLERNRRQVSLTRRWSHLDAGDIAQLETSPGQWSAVIVHRTSDDGTVVSMQVADADPALLSALGYGASPGTGQDGVDGIAITGLTVADIPMIREQDSDAGVYVGLYGIGTGWSGAALFAGQSVDHLESQGVVTRGAARGFATSVLASWGINMVDEVGSVTVQLSAGALYTTTRAMQIDHGTNMCLLGSELLSFRNAVDLGNGLYQLSGLMRGLRGTERFSASHRVGEPFLLLDAGGILRVPLSPGQIGTEYQWRGVSFGQTLSQGQTIAHTPTGASAKPLAPVGARKSVAAGDITLTWDRRTRSLQDFPANGVDVPLFETSEAYEIDIFASGAFSTIKRTLFVSSASAIYTASHQTVDFGASQSTVNVRIHQIGAAGRGHYLQATL